MSDFDRRTRRSFLKGAAAVTGSLLAAPGFAQRRSSGFAYVGWYRETERASDLVSMGFLFGSLAVVSPMLLATIVHRIQRNFQPGLDDLGVIVACIGTPIAVWNV